MKVGENMKKLSIFMVFVMLVSLLAGCSTKKEKSTPDSESSMVTTAENEGGEEEAEEQPPAEEEVVEETFDFGGMEVVIASPWATDLTPGSSRGNDMLIERIAEVEEKYNVKIDYKDCSDDQIGGNFFQLAVQGMLSGETLGDFMHCRTGDYIAWKNAGVLQDLNPYTDVLDLDNTEKWSKLILDNTTEGNKTYGLATNPNAMFTYVTFNKRLFDEAGLDYPYEYIKNGQWDFNKVAEVAKKLTIDTDGDGTVDQYGLTAYSPAALGHTMIIANGGQLIDDKKGKPLFVADEPKTMEALNIFHHWYNVDKFVVPLQEGEWDSQVKLFESGKVAMMVASDWMLTRFHNNLEDEYGVAFFPQGPSSGGTYKSLISKLGFYVLPVSTTKDKEKLLTVYAALTDPYYDDPLEGYMEGVEERLHDEESLQTLIDYHKEQNGGELVFSSISNYGLEWSAPEDIRVSPTLFNRIVEGEAPSAVIEEKKAAIQQYLKDMFGE